MTQPPSAREWSEDGVPHIDVRGLAPPQPLVTILRRVQGEDVPVRLVVHHDRDPVMLYPELAQIGWQAERVPAPPGEVRLLLTPMPP
jgi:hypothetical protein